MTIWLKSKKPRRPNRRRAVRKRLKRIYKAHGYLTMKEWEKKVRSPSAYTILYHFGSWVAAWESIGAEIPKKSKSPSGVGKFRTWSDRDILEALRSHGRYISRSEWMKNGYKPSDALIRRRFGGYNLAWKLAGIQIPKRTKPTRADAIEAVQSQSGYLTAAEWDEKGLYPTSSQIMRLLNCSWRSVWIEYTDVKPRPDKPVQDILASVTEEELANLTSIQAAVVQMRLEGYIQSEIASEFGISRERVRQLIKISERNIMKMRGLL